LFGAKSNDEDDEGTIAPTVAGKPSAASVTALAKSAEAKPAPPSKLPKASTLQLASADLQLVQPAKVKVAAADAPAASADKAQPKPQTPADIINARGFWDEIPTTPQNPTPAEAAALSAREALAADPQPTANVSAAFEAFAYAPTPIERAKVVAASAPIPHNARPASAPRNPMVVTDVTTVVAKGTQGRQGQESAVATSSRIATYHGNEVWIRAMILAPSASASLSTTVLGDTDMTLMRAHFVKPRSAITMAFSDDPLMGMVCDRFTGSAIAVLATQTFAMRTASLR
jgi:hypothetical protein